MKLTALAPGKVNLCLFLGTTRADGLHPLVSLFQPVSLADGLTLTEADGDADADEVFCPGVEGTNLVEKALSAYRRATSYKGPPVCVAIDKRIPVAAGMGGGSADAAAALRLIAYAAGRPADPAVHAIAPALGADVPSQIEPRRALVTGAGEHVEQVLPGPRIGLLILPSAESLSTPEVFKEADRLGLPRDDVDLAGRELAVRAALDGGGLPLELAVNDLQPAAISLCPSIEDALARMLEAGARRALVSGSGPTVFGIFGSPEESAAAAGGLPGSIPAEPVDMAFGAVNSATLGPS